MMKQFKEYMMERAKRRELKAIKNELVKLDPVNDTRERQAMIQKMEKLL